MSEVLYAETGRETGSRSSGRLRREGKVPAVLYGLGLDAQSITLNWPDLRRALIDAGSTGSIRLSVGGVEHLTLVRELQRHPVRRDVSHVDFLAVDPDEAVEVDVSLVVGGLEEGDEGNDIELALRSVTVSSKPGAIPSELLVDANVVRETGAMNAGALVLPAGVTLITPAEDMIASIPAKLAAAAELAAAAAAEAAAAGETED